MDKTPLEKCLITAKEAGVPKDQADRLLSSGYVPYPWQWRFHAAAREADLPNGPVDIGLGGARGPGKSHAVLAQAGLDDCQRFNNLKGLFLRQTGNAAKESFDDLVEKVIAGRVSYERSGNVLKFPNTKSRIILGGFQDENDIDKYIGIEYDFIIVEELNQLTKDKYQKLRGSLRTSKPNWRPRMYTSFNPGGKGHQLVKERYVIPHRMLEENQTRFVPSTYKSNPALNKEYVEYLEGLEGDLGRAWREGDFDLFAGQYFQEWRYETNTCKPFDIPPYWKRIIMADYGYAAPSAVYWGAVDHEGKLYIYRELYRKGLTYEKLAEEICSLTLPHEEISYWVFDPAIWAKKGESSAELSGAEIIQKKVKDITGRTPNMIKANNDRVVGWNALREYLKPIQLQDKIGSMLQVFTTCIELIRTLPTLVYDAHKVEDLDTDGEDHGADAVRYGVMSRPPKAPGYVSQATRLFNNKAESNQATEYE